MLQGKNIALKVIDNVSNTNKLVKKLQSSLKAFIFVSTVPVLHTIRTALGSFFFTTMPNKPARNVIEQLHLLKKRGMTVENKDQAIHFLSNISYYRLKGYWWDMQTIIYLRIAGS